MWFGICFPLLFMFVLSVGGDEEWERVTSKNRPATTSIIPGPTKSTTLVGWRSTTPEPARRRSDSFNGRDRDRDRSNPSAGSGQSSLRRTQSAPSLRSVSDLELQTLSEQLLAVDVNNAASSITFLTSSNGRTRIVLVDERNIRNIPTYATLERLLPFYKPDLSEAESDTESKRAAEDAFLTEIMNTEVMRRLMKFLADGDFITSNPKGQFSWMRTIWFTPYHRGKGRGSANSCGFEHVFLGETNGEIGKVDGLHNWYVMFLEQEKNQLSILDVRDTVIYKDEASGKVKALVKAVKVTYHGLSKPYSTVAMGLSPELQMAYDTMCFFFRTDDKCNLKVARKNFTSQTHSWYVYPLQRQVIASVYPVIERNYTSGNRSPTERHGSRSFRGRP